MLKFIIYFVTTTNHMKFEWQKMVQIYNNSQKINIFWFDDYLVLRLVGGFWLYSPLYTFMRLKNRLPNETSLLVFQQNWPSCIKIQSNSVITSSMGPPICKPWFVISVKLYVLKETFLTIFFINLDRYYREFVITSWSL